MRSTLVIALFTLTGACAFPAQVKHFGVEYNTALSDMANEQTLLNILRAKEGMPSHFTSVNRFTGAIAVKASGSLNAQLRGQGLTRTVAGAATTDVTAEGVDLYTPQVGGELTSGTTFEVGVFDQQKFYQGILGAVSFATVENFLNQGVDNALIMHLLIARVDFYRLDKDGAKTGDSVSSIQNSAEDRERFSKFVDCNLLGEKDKPGKAAMIAPIARMARDANGKPVPLSLKQLMMIDGEKFGLSSDAGVSADGKTDDSVYLVRNTAPKRAPTFFLKQCQQATKPITPPREAIYQDGGKAILVNNGVPELAPVAIEVVFRSPEGVIRALGRYLREAEKGRASTFCPYPAVAAECGPLFSVFPKRVPNALVSAHFLGRDYSVANDSNSYRSMQVITIVQQLINLQKEASEQPTSIPVRAVP